MFDDLRDKFESDEEYEEFKNSYNDYKNQTGMFDATKFIKDLIEFQELLYNSFVVEKKQYIYMPEKYIKTKNTPLCVFYTETLPDTNIIILNIN